jgi:hypothetical protein
MKLKSFTYSTDWGTGGHLIKVTEPCGVDVALSDFQPSPELVTMIEREAAVEIAKRRAKP